MSSLPTPKLVPESGRLDSWKQIAAYLDKSERTVRRWEQTEGLPIHKHLHTQKGSVWAYQQELDEWLAGRRVSPEPVIETPAEKSLLVRPALRWGIPAACFAAAIAAGGWFYSHRSREPLPAPVPFTAFAGSEYGPTFSPDGRQVAFFWGSDATPHGIYVKSVNSDQATPLDVNDGYAYSPAWSPDGRTIAFLRRTRENETWLCVIAATGGPARRLLLLNTRAAYSGNSRHISWGPDSQWLLAPLHSGPREDGIRRITLDGEQRLVTEPDPAHSPVLAPDGRSFAYINFYATSTGTYSIALQRVTTQGEREGKSQILYQGQGMPAGLDWAPNGKELILCTAAISPADGIGGRLYRLPATPNARPALLGPSAHCSGVAVSRPDATGRTTLMFGSAQGGKDLLWQGRLDDLDRAAEFVPSSRGDSQPSFSPDGKSIAFVSRRSGQNEVWLVEPDGSAPRRLTENTQVVSRPDWSPDGTRLLYGSASSKPPGLVTVPIAGGSAKPLPLEGQVAQDPVWSLDGKHIYYSSGTQLWRCKADGSERKMLRDDGRQIPVGESPDGRFLYVVKMRKLVFLARIPIGGGPEQIIEGALSFTRNLHRDVAMTKTALYFTYSDGGLYRMGFDGKRTLIRKAFLGTDPRRFTLLYGIAVAPDEQRIVWAVLGPMEVDLEMIPDFR